MGHMSSHIVNLKPGRKEGYFTTAIIPSTKTVKSLAILLLEAKNKKKNCTLFFLNHFHR
jgi:hypothetical protein